MAEVLEVGVDDKDEFMYDDNGELTSFMCCVWNIKEYYYQSIQSDM